MARSDHIFSLKGKRVLVTGATGHLGFAMAQGLCELGATVLVNGRRKDRVSEAVSWLQADGFSAEAAPFDITNDIAVSDYFRQMGADSLHAIINNAYAGESGSIETAGTASYAKSYEVAVTSAHRIIVSALGPLRSAVKCSGGASVVNIASMYGMVSPDQRVYGSKESANPPFYGAAKAALMQWTRYAACEFGPEGIRVNAISPAPFPSESIQQSNPGLLNALIAKVPLGRVGMADEIKGPVVFLVSDASSFVTGANIVVDGGWTCW